MTSISNQQILTGFTNPTPPPADNTFEFALVLGGTVSAGAYTAGALDFIIEALDTWTNLRDADDGQAPKHNVLLRTITGTSGGGVNAAIAARALAYQFPAVHLATQNPGSENPFYDVWVNRLDLNPMLDTSDLRSGMVMSLLDGKVIDEAASYIENFSSNTLQKRSYVADPLKVILTLTNLRGIPYKTDFGAANMSQTYIDHADYARFNIVYPGQKFNDPRGDEWMLGFGDMRSSQATSWSDFSLYARATGAFPIGLPPRQLHRPKEHYRYRVAVLGTTPADVSLLIPDWSMIPDQNGDYVFVSVDGGATDNEPIQLARTSLCGVLKSNPRKGIEANRGVLLIDPFAGNANLGEEKVKGLFGMGGELLNTLVQQTRYDSRDILLAQHPDIYSRFMISAVRDGIVGDKALATAGLGAFMGFASKTFRRHDYLLGRANAQAYLKEKFVLPENSEVFKKHKDCWTEDQKRLHKVTDSNGNVYLPIIPLLGNAAITESTEPFPKHKLNPEDFREAIEDRYKALVEAEGGGSVLASIGTWFLAHLGEGKVADMVIKQMEKTLDEWGLS